jgi:hypothetical protein
MTSLIVSIFLGLLISRTDFLEKLKKYLLEKNCRLLVKGMDCPFCSCFWCGLLVSFIFDFNDFILISASSAVLGFFIAKGT